jgi:hypothetical protein
MVPWFLFLFLFRVRGRPRIQYAIYFLDENAHTHFRRHHEPGTWNRNLEPTLSSVHHS